MSKKRRIEDSDLSDTSGSVEKTNPWNESCQKSNEKTIQNKLKNSKRMKTSIVQYDESDSSSKKYSSESESRTSVVSTKRKKKGKCLEKSKQNNILNSKQIGNTRVQQNSKSPQKRSSHSSKVPILETGACLSESGSETPLSVGSSKGSKEKNQFNEKGQINHQTIDESEEEVIPIKTQGLPAKMKRV